MALPPYPLPADNRLAPTETSGFRLVNATLIFIQLHPDHDYHLVVQDQNGRTLIVESPDPNCAPADSSAYLTQMKAVRQYLDANFTVTPAGQDPNVPVTVTGIGFFDYLYRNLYGQAPNGIELHPLLYVCIGPNC